jgi:hypothetical protein
MVRCHISDFSHCFTGLKTSQEAVWRLAMSRHVWPICGRMAWRTFSLTSWSSSKVWSATGTDYQCQGKICQSLLVTPACKTCLLQYVPFHFRFLWMSSWANYCLDDSQLYSSHPPKVLCNSDLIHQHGIAWFQERQSTLRVAFKVLFHQNTGKGDIRHRLGQIGTFRSTSSTLGAFEDGAHRAK